MGRAVCAVERTSLICHWSEYRRGHDRSGQDRTKEEVKISYTIGSQNRIRVVMLTDEYIIQQCTIELRRIAYYIIY